MTLQLKPLQAYDKEPCLQQGPHVPWQKCDWTVQDAYGRRPRPPHPRYRTQQDPSHLQTKPPGAETFLLHSLEGNPEQIKGIQTFLLVLKRTKATGPAGGGCGAHRDPTSCSHSLLAALAAAPSSTSCPPRLPARVSLLGLVRHQEKVKQLLGNTNTTQGWKTSLLQINFFQTFKCSKKTLTGPFTRRRAREGRSPVTPGLLLPDWRPKMVF